MLHFDTQMNPYYSSVSAQPSIAEVKESVHNEEKTQTGNAKEPTAHESVGLALRMVGKDIYEYHAKQKASGV